MLDNENNLRLKSGVSLITVLLFMLVATIAATATYKLLTSGGFSSASRMRQQEAYQSALAGIENTRMWMTSHANDVGALVKAFIDGGEKPINLDARVRRWQRAKQDYHVWLTGVNTENSTYKLKILSSGVSQIVKDANTEETVAKWDEVAIFNVDGLYQVKLLVEEKEEIVATAPFKYNYFGGSTQSQGHMKAYSLMINGDLFGANPVYTEENLIVTGDVHMTGNSVGAGGTACIGGNISADNGVFGNDFYVGGNATKGFTFPSASEAAGVSRADLTGNVYIEGNLAPPDPGDQVFQKNLTLNGVWTTNLGAHESKVKGNLCLGPKAQVIIDKKNASRKFIVGKNVWAKDSTTPYVFPIWVQNGEKNEGEYDHIILGDSANSTIYLRSVHSRAEYETLVNDRTFIEKNTYFRGSAGYAMAGPQSRWDNKTTRVYKELPPHLKNKTDAYYLYYYDGPGQDVDFIVSRASGFGMGNTYYANYYVENQPFYSTGSGMPGMYGYVAPGNHLLNMNGNKPVGSPYCKAMADKWRPECGVTPWFKSNGTISRNVPAEESRGFECAESVKAHCDMIWRKTPGEGCPHEGTSTVNNWGRGGKADYKVDDILVTAYQKFEKYANFGCRDVTHWGSTMSDRLNRCYRENTSSAQRAKDSLYNGYQVVKVKRNWMSNPNTPLKGKFIIIVTEPMGQQNLPPTTSDSYVFLYLAEGTGHGGGNTYTLQPAVDNGTYNYFIYTPKDIDGLMFNNAVFSGSIYAKAANCAKVGDIKTRRMDFNEDLMNDLTANGVVCAASIGEDACGSAGVTSSSSGGESSASAESGSSFATSGYDSFYISMAPQLGVRLESQSKSKEALPEAGEENVTVLSPSFIVLPRIIYLPSDPFGSLTDYYNVQALNGSTLKKNDVTVSCTGPSTLHTTGKLYIAPTKLTKGLYTCTAKATSYPDIPFWVSVGENSARETKIISFKEQSQEMGSNSEVNVQLNVPALAQELKVSVYCPDPDNSAWSYVSLGANVTRTGTTCEITLPASDETTTPTLATIKTTNAVEGTMVFQLFPGEGYIPGSPQTTELFIRSIAQLNRSDVTSNDIADFCKDHSSICPDGYASYWPDCDVAGVWVQPTGTFINKVANESWAIMVGNQAPVTLAEFAGSGCVVIVPTEGNSITTVEGNKTYSLRASAKAVSSTFTVGFSGVVGGNGRDPMIKVYTSHGTESRHVKTCKYSEATTGSGTSAKKCTVSIFKGENVTVVLDDTDAQDFSFWRCTGSSCPTTDATITSKTYDSFTLSDNETELIAVFGEKDKHCFFDEFKRDSVGCDATDAQMEYCIDKCSENDATSVCSAADDATGIFKKAKWHLISGILSQIITGPSGEIHIDKAVIKKKKQTAREPIVVMSTVNAGVVGTLKALINVPRVNSSYDKSAVNIKKSGFMLRANNFGNDYFMLNLYENSNGVLEAQLTRGETSLSATLTRDDGYSTARVSNSKMVMVTAEITALDTLKVRANVGDFYGGSPTEYECVFALADFNNTLADVAHEYVGFSLADPNFKIYGIGWKSGTYNSECHDTYPTVKCSFAAVATDGVIKTGVDVKPWVGHSGWFDSKGCSPLYYYNGDDACLDGTCDVYNFAESGIGAHGYTVVDNDTKTKTEVKTAKAWLGNCLYNISEESVVAWGVTADKQRAHCGAFWTGKFSECAAHQDLFGDDKIVNYGLEETIVFEKKQNLRAATLHITLENTASNEVEIWLVSESENWGESDHESHSVKMTGNTETFDVIQEFATGSSGFDPENVKQIVFKNHGSGNVTVKSITSTCANAIGITYCRADFDGDKWNVTTQVTNKDLVTKEQVVATVTDGFYGFNVTKNATGDDVIAWNGDIALISIPDPNIYNQHQGKHYVFNATITGSSDEQTAEKPCSVSPDPIGKIGVNCSVVGSIASGTRFPTFNIYFNGCPGAGCAYEVYIDDTKFVNERVEKTSASHSADMKEECNVTAGCEHIYTVITSYDTTCSDTFKVLRKEDDVPPTVICGISTSPDRFSTDPVFTGNSLYFVAYNEKAEEKTYSVTLKKGETQVGTATLQHNSERTNVKSLGDTLPVGTHTYSLYVGNDKVCDASVTVNDASGACTIGGNLYTGQQLSMTVSGVNANTQFTWTLKKDGQTVGSRTIDCGTANCWNHTMNAPTTAGSYTYTVTKGAKELCNGSVDIAPILSCEVKPDSVGRGVNYTFTVNAAVNCWNCSFTDDAGSTENNLGINASWTKTKAAGNAIGDKTLSFNCNSCNNNVSASCSTPLKVIKTKPTFSCVDNLKATVDKDNNVKIRIKDITNCDADDPCRYSISGTGSDATVYTGCTNTSCSHPAITNKETTSGNTETYAVTLENTTGSTTENCSVEFITGPTCATITKNFDADNTTITGNLSNGCADITTNRICSGEVQIEIQGCKGKTGSWNGTSFTLNNNDNGYYKFDANPNPKKENSLEMPDCPTAQINKVYLAGCADRKPVISCAALSTTKTKGSSVVLKPSVTNCDNTTKCSYTITSGGTTEVEHSEKDWTSGSEMGALGVVTTTGEKTYKLTVANDYDESEECEFKINYVDAGNAPIELTDGSSNISVPCGRKIHAIGSCSNKNVIISCAGNFQKTVCGNGADSYSTLRYYVGYSQGENKEVTCETSCGENTMNCSLICDN